MHTLGKNIETHIQRLVNEMKDSIKNPFREL